MDYKLEKFETFNDDRGKLVVFLKELDLDAQMKKFGQIYFVTFNSPGVIRGNHYHKKWHEWFGIVGGRTKVVLEDVNNMERKEFILDSAQDGYARLKIGPNIAHAFQSLSDQAYLLNYANGMWDLKDTIKYKLI